MFLLNEKLNLGNESLRRRIYERLWFELTVAGRAVWSDSALSNEAKLEGLKWLNEIQHRVWRAHAEAGGISDQDLDRYIAHHVLQAPEIAPHVTRACRICCEL